MPHLAWIELSALQMFYNEYLWCRRSLLSIVFVRSKNNLINKTNTYEIIIKTWHQKYALFFLWDNDLTVYQIYKTNLHPLRICI